MFWLGQNSFYILSNYNFVSKVLRIHTIERKCRITFILVSNLYVFYLKLIFTIGRESIKVSSWYLSINKPFVFWQEEEYFNKRGRESFGNSYRRVTIYLYWLHIDYWSKRVYFVLCRWGGGRCCCSHFRVYL